MQPTGLLHLGHYLGVLRNFTRLQHEHDSYFMVANWHSLTIFYSDYRQAHDFISPLVSDWLAAGLDPEKCTIFLQSDVQAHAELSLILSMFTPVSWLTRNPTYKEKQENIEKDIDSHGFLGYPVLQAADILLYEAEQVPIGEDQLPHLELTREIARRFNHLVDQDTLVVPKALLSEYPKVVGTDGRKMSKSYNNTLVLADAEEALTAEMRKMKTDTARVRRDDPGNPEDCPVFTYYDFFAADKKETIAAECRSAKIGCSDCKKIISSAMVEDLKPFREKKAEVQENKKLISDVLMYGAEKAEKVANQTLEKVKSKMGFKSI